MRYPIFFILCFVNVPITTETAAWADQGDASGTRAISAPPAISVQGRSVTPVESKPGAADGATTACQQRPWHCGVSEDDKKHALSLYREGNVLFDDSLFKPAAARYLAALEHWKHPGIYYNLMLCLIALDQPIDAYQYSLGALQYGALPLGTEEHRRTLAYHKLLRGRVAVLDVTSNEPGAVVFLNGKLLFAGPGRVRQFVEPGLHELVARKPGHLVSRGTLTLVPGKSLHAQLTMLPEDQSTLVVRRWPHWQPWAIAGSGVGMGLLAGAVDWRARERIGHGLLIAGAATAVTGLVLALHNQPRRVGNPARRNLIRISVAPGIGSSAASALVTGAF